MDPVFVDLNGRPVSSDQKKIERQEEFNERLTQTVKALRDWYVLCELGVITPDLFADPQISNLIVRAHKDLKRILEWWGVDTTMRAKIKAMPVATSAKLQAVPVSEQAAPNEDAST